MLEALDEDRGVRLDVVLARRVPGLSRRRAQAMLERGAVRLNGRKARKGERVAPGDELVFDEPPTPSDFPARPDPGVAIVVRFEDEHLALIDKPAGVPSHPLAPDELGTAASFVVARWPETCLVGHRAREPGLVHRLDTGTSGLLLVAKDASTFEALRSALERGAIDKTYVGFVDASSALRAPCVIDAPIAHHPTDARRVLVGRAREDARPARTEVLSVSRGPKACRVVVRAACAFRHQVRAHLAYAGYPLLGDLLYGGRPFAGLARHALHADSIAFDHPVRGERIRVEAPLPEDLTAIWR